MPFINHPRWNIWCAYSIHEIALLLSITACASSKWFVAKILVHKDIYIQTWMDWLLDDIIRHVFFTGLISGGLRRAMVSCLLVRLAINMLLVCDITCDINFTAVQCNWKHDQPTPKPPGWAICKPIFIISEAVMFITHTKMTSYEMFYPFYMH